MRTVVSYELEPLSVEYLATHEIASAGIEESIFSNISEVREDKPLPTLSDVECVLLNGAEQSTRIGTAIVLRAMAGDKFSVGAYSYHAGKNIEEDN